MYGACDMCGWKRLVGTLKTTSPSGSFSRNFKLCMDCIKKIEALIDGRGKLVRGEVKMKKTVHGSEVLDDFGM